MSLVYLHIIAFDVPYPPDYGGVIDVFYKIKALSEAGVKIHLHCFEYGRERAEELNKYCERVSYYRRFKSPKYLLARRPFIVETRDVPELLQNLSADSHPILFEGLHTTAFLNHKSLANRMKLVRAHNVEHDYYNNLAKGEKNPFRKLFFQTEADKLKRYEAILKSAQKIIAISKKDEQYFAETYGNTVWVNPFHPHNEFNVGGSAGYAFYHGNLSVNENKRALKYLLKEVYLHTDVPLVVAGKDAHRACAEVGDEAKRLKIVSNPGTDEMLRLAKDASVHVLPTFQDTGFKLKLLYSLYTAPAVVVNPLMVAGTTLAPFCEIAHTPEEMAQKITSLHTSPVNEEKLAERKNYLAAHFSNRENALKILDLLRRYSSS